MHHIIRHLFSILALLWLSTSASSNDRSDFLLWFDLDSDVNNTTTQSLIIDGPEVLFDEGRQGNVLRFDAPTDIALVDSIDLNGLSSISMFAWIRPQSAIGYAKEGRVISRAISVEAEDHYWMLGLGGDGSSVRFRLKTSEGGTTTLISSLGLIEMNQWTHVAATYDGSFMRLFVNGREAGRVQKKGRIVDSNTVKASIGNQSSGQSRGFIGEMDSVGVTDVVFDEQRIAELMELGINALDESPTSEVIGEIGLSDGVDDPSPISSQDDASNAELVQCGKEVTCTEWNDVTSLYAQTLNDQYEGVVFGWGGYSVSGSRNQFQIDFDIQVQKSEKLIVEFAVPVNLASLTIGRLEQSEWAGKNEIGLARVFNSAGVLVDNVELNPAKGVLVESSGSVYKFDLTSAQDAAKVIIQAVPYASLEDSVTLTNESDFNVQGLEYELDGQRTVLRGQSQNSTDSDSTIVYPEAEQPIVELIDEEEPSITYLDELPMGGIFYGNYEYGYHTGNARIAFESSRRFRAEKSGNITAIKFNNRTLDDNTIESRCSAGDSNSVWCQCVNSNLDKYQCGYTLGNSYSVGNGGSLVVEVQTDAKGLPSGEIIGATRDVFVPMENANSHYPRLPFSSGVSITAGSVYHLVFKNLNPPINCTLSGVSASEASRCEKSRGAIGLNGISFAKNGNGSNFRDPFRGSSAANLVRSGVGRSWSLDADNLSWYEIEYEDGTWVGDSHVAHGASTSGKKTIGGSTVARQIFTVEEADRIVDGIWLNFSHTVGFTGVDVKLEMLLKSSDGTSLGSTYLKESNECKDDADCTYWSYGEFNNVVTLEQGRTYSVEIRSSGTGVFSLSAFFPLNYGAWNSTSRNHWVNARSEVSLDGGVSWNAWSSSFSDRDLPLLFTIAGNPRYLD